MGTLGDLEPARGGMTLTGSLSSLETARAALDEATARIANARTDQPGRLPELRQAHADRALVWRAIAKLSFADIVAGDLLARAAQHAADYDDLISRTHGSDGPDRFRPAAP
jgi:hypothetical protein